MKSSTEGLMPAVSAWQLEFARLVAFPAEPPVFMDQHWWQELTTGQAEDVVSIRKKHFCEDRGKFQGVELSLTVDLGRVAWSIQPCGEADDSGHLPTIGPYREKIDWAVELLSTWLAHQCPPLMRLAFTAKLLKPAATHMEAYQALGDHLHLPTELFYPDPPNDFFMQINRRRKSQVIPGLGINRVSAWSKLNLAVSAESSARTPFQWPDKCYSVVELDMNTAPERADLLPHESLLNLLHELKSLGLEIAGRGDIR